MTGRPRSAAFAAIASSPSTSLISDSTFAVGDDIDGDGHSDVAGGITTCQDADSDGDFEFPAGFYKAGTILDNDVQYNTKTTNGFRFTVNDSELDTVVFSLDLEGTALHEFGHSFGLAHSFINQTKPTDGTGATMFPFIDTGDPATEVSLRTPHPDATSTISVRSTPPGSSTARPAGRTRSRFRRRSSIRRAVATPMS